MINKLLENERYEEALEFAKEGKDLETYDQAYTLLRNKRLSKNFNIYAILIIGVFCYMVNITMNRRSKNVK